MDNGKTGLDNLVIKDANLADSWHVIVDKALIHEFCGNQIADVSLNGQFRDPDVNRLLENAARTK